MKDDEILHDLRIEELKNFRYTSNNNNTYTEREKEERGRRKEEKGKKKSCSFHDPTW